MVLVRVSGSVLRTPLRSASLTVLLIGSAKLKITKTIILQFYESEFKLLSQGSRLTFLQTSPVASDNFDFTSQNQFSTSQNFQ